MATKSITITEDAYNRLAAVKQEKESFSDVIKRIVPKSSFRDLIGILTDKDAEELKRHSAEIRKRVDKQIRERAHDI